MELEKHRRWSKIAAVGMGAAAVLSIAASFFQGWNLPRILMVLCFGASSVLYYVQYRNLLKEED
jgi:ABC-type enterobactin transport system permease subunit